MATPEPNMTEQLTAAVKKMRQTCPRNSTQTMKPLGPRAVRLIHVSRTLETIHERR